MDTGWLALALHGMVGHRPEVWGGAVPQERTPAEVRAEAGTEETRQFVRRVRRVTRRKFTPEEKVWVVLKGFRGEVKVSELCRWEGIRPNVLWGAKITSVSGQVMQPTIRTRGVGHPALDGQ